MLGFSSGGFGAWNLGSRNPDVFGALAMLSGDTFRDMTHKFMPCKSFDSIWPEPPNGPIEGNIWSQLVYDYSANYSPHPDNPPFYVDLPVAWRSGELRQDVWDRWLAFDPVVNVRDRLDDLRKLAGVMLDAGSHDDYNLHWGHRVLVTASPRPASLTSPPRTRETTEAGPTRATRWRSSGWGQVWRQG